MILSHVGAITHEIVPSAGKYSIAPNISSDTHTKKKKKKENSWARFEPDT